MAIIAKSSGGGKDFIPAPGGTHSAVCVDVVDMGLLEVNFGGKKKSQHKVRIVWQISETMADNKPYICQKRYTLSLHEKAVLRKDLESWRGRAFSADELEGFDLEVLIGITCLLNVLQVKKDGETYSNVVSIMRLPKGMEPMKQRDYTRVKDRSTAETAAADAAPPEHGPEDGYMPTDDDVPW